MIGDFYQALQDAQLWFFGQELLNDAFFSGILNIFNSGLLIAMFYSVLVYPMKKCVKWMIDFMKGFNK